MKLVITGHDVLYVGDNFFIEFKEIFKVYNKNYIVNIITGNFVLTDWLNCLHIIPLGLMIKWVL